MYVFPNQVTHRDYKTQNRKSNSKLKNRTSVTKLKSTFYLFLAQTGTEQPGQGAMLLGWPKSIYYGGDEDGVEETLTPKLTSRVVSRDVLTV